jgi:hypothetical protein
MTFIALLASAGLIIIAAVHLLWALGIWWPIKDETALARAVVGSKGIKKMPRATSCSLVVVALLAVASRFQPQISGSVWHRGGLSIARHRRLRTPDETRHTRTAFSTAGRNLLRATMHGFRRDIYGPRRGIGGLRR